MLFSIVVRCQESGMCPGVFLLYGSEMAGVKQVSR